MNRLLPSPLLSLGLLVLWILLMQSASPGTLLLGTVLAVFWPAVTSALRPTPVRIRRPLTILRLFGRVVLDMLHSSVAVARAILAGAGPGTRPGLVDIPLELEDPNGLAVLAMIVTFTPGTAWVQLSADRRRLLLHVLAIEDEAAVIQLIKRRYEGPLMEIFQ
jgi:multicomponent K+:H+ antiporter subunit E